MENEKTQVDAHEKTEEDLKSSIKSSDNSNDQSTVIVPPNRVLLYGTTAFVSLGALLFGYDQGVISTIIASDSWLQEFGYPDSGLIGAVVSLFDVGCLFGALSNAWTASRLGRERAMALTTVVCIVGVIIQTFAVHIVMMIIGRFILGFGVGALSGLVPLYQAEIAPAHIRGRLISIEQMVLCFGEMIATWIDYGFSFLAPTLPIWWRIPLGIQIIPAIILVIGCFYILPSPRWLAEKERWDECLNVLTRLHGTEAAQVEFRQIQDTIKLERETSVGSYGELFNRRYRKRTLIAMATAGLQQLTGTNSILYFAPTLFGKAGLDQQSSFLATGGVGIVLFVTSWIPIWTIDRWSRKGYFMVGSFVMMLAMIGIAVTQAMTELHPNIIGNAGNVIVFWPYLFYTAFNVTWGPLAWLVPNEIMDITMRAKGNALATATLWLCNVGVAQFSPMIVAKINWGLYPIYAGINFISIFLIYFFWVESANVPLEEMAALFEGAPRKREIGVEDLIDRYKAAAEAGADAAFIEGITSKEEAEQVATALAQEMGLHIRIYPCASTVPARIAINKALDELLQDGTDVKSCEGVNPRDLFIQMGLPDVVSLYKAVSASGIDKV